MNSAPMFVADNTSMPVADAWGRLGLRLRRWAVEHQRPTGRVMLVRAVLNWAAVAAVAAAVALRPELGESVRVDLRIYWLLILWFWLCRSKTLSWRFVSGWFAASLVWALIVGRLTHALALRVTEVRLGTLLLDGNVRFDGPSVAIAAVGEESLKLLPLAAFALLAAQRVLRWTVADFLLAGLVSGLAFQMCEETLRRLAGHVLRPGFREILQGPGNRGPSSGYPQYSLSPLSGWSQNAGGGEFPGHHITTGVVAAAVGLGVWLARRGDARPTAVRWSLVTIAVVPAMLAWWIAVGVHGGANATIAVQGQSWTSSIDVAWLIRSGWAASSDGSYLGPILLAAWLAALLLDARQRRRADGTDAAGPLADVRAMLRYSRDDALTALRAHARVDDERRSVALVRGRTAMAGARERWADSAQTSHPQRSRPSVFPRLVAAAAASALIATVTILAPRWARDIGSSLLVPGPGWLAGFFDALGGWWSHQPLAVQLLVIAAAAGLIVLSGGSFSLALFSTGLLASIAEHAHGVADLIRDPRAAVRSYLATTTPQSAAVDLLELVLTLVPAGVGAKGGLLAREELDRAITRVVTSEADPAARTALETAARGAARETKVAEITGGRVVGAPGKPGLKVVKPNVGATDVDVIGAHGEYIAVGGPAKAHNVAKLAEKLRILHYAADQAGVPAQAYFEAGTPQAAIDKAIQILGADNVFVFGL